MKTLIIHPHDSTTDFLSVIYKDIPQKTVITYGVTKKEIREQMKIHERIIMLGHGSPGGLMSVGMFGETNGFVVDYSMVDILKQKKNNVFIWCNADQFVLDHELDGFYSGMFISEVSEANYCGLFGIKKSDILTSNNTFCKIISENINEESTVIYDKVKNEYGELAKFNKVAHYNNRRIYLK